MTCRKKLIEVALPLEAINRESAHEKSVPRRGHPATLHLWWARRPLAACRAVLFASLVDDPSSRPEAFPTEAAQEQERQRLFRILEELVQWENSHNGPVLAAARAEIQQATGGSPPPVLDPFCGGGAIPLEAQRLGLQTYASDLNPVAVLITRALTEIPPKFAGQPPVHPGERGEGRGEEEQGTGSREQEIGNRKGQGDAEGRDTGPSPGFPDRRSGNLGAAPHHEDQQDAHHPLLSTPHPIPHSPSPVPCPLSPVPYPGLAEDVRYYGRWIRQQAERRIGHLYPKVRLSEEAGSGEATVIAWLWARTVQCLNPACRAPMPLVRSFWLSKKKGKKAWVEPVVEETEGRGEGAGGLRERRIRFTVRTGEGTPPDGTMRQRAATCPICHTASPLPYLRAEARAGRMGLALLAIVAEAPRGRIYLPPDPHHEEIARNARPPWRPDERVTTPSHDVDRLPMYGMDTWGDAFTPRQLVALTTLTDLIGEAWAQVRRDALAAGLPDDSDTGATAYADAVATYLAFALDKLADWSSMFCSWIPSIESVKQTFARQALPMVWDPVEINPLSHSVGNYENHVAWVASGLSGDPTGCPSSTVCQHNATAPLSGIAHALICTDPPYYDNISYADISDFFYVWLRRSLGRIDPALFGTLLTPKIDELVATPHRFDGNRKKAQAFFREGLAQVFRWMRQTQHPDYPLTLFYAFKQMGIDAEDSGDPGAPLRASTGWEALLTGLIQAGFMITGTWPMRTERDYGMKSGTNVLASSIVLVCRPRPAEAPSATRRDFLSALQRELPGALKQLQHGHLAPVDLAQAAIGPGMAAFSRYSRILEADGRTMSVRTALALINQALDEALAEQESLLDAETRWAVAWFEQFGFEEAPFGVAETLSKAKNTAVSGLMEARIVHARAGKVRLLRRNELSPDGDPASDRPLIVWKATLALIHALEQEGEPGAARLLARLGGLGALARDLAYRLFTLCERNRWAPEALAFNRLVGSWTEMARLAGQGPSSKISPCGSHNQGWPKRPSSPQDAPRPDRTSAKNWAIDRKARVK